MLIGPPPKLGVMVAELEGKRRHEIEVCRWVALRADGVGGGERISRDGRLK